MLRTVCPYCAKENNLHAGVNGRPTPKDGDISVCIGCGAVSEYDRCATGGLKRMTDAEVAKVMEENPEIAKIQSAWALIRGKNEKRS